MKKGILLFLLFFTCAFIQFSCSWESVTFDEVVISYREKGFSVDTDISIASDRMFKRELGGGKQFAKIMDGDEIAALIVEFASESEFKNACTVLPLWRSAPKKGLIVLLNVKGGANIETLFKSL